MTSTRRLLRAALAASVLALTALSATMVIAPPPASAAPGQCPPGYEPVGPGDDPDFFDQNVSVFAGGNFSVGQEAAEAEGVLVALGNATFQRASAGRYNVGVVGQGSGVPPNPGTDMLVVGGDMSGNSLTTVDVGFGIGGNVVVGGTIAAGTLIETSGGTIRQGVPNATAPYAGIPAQISAKSAEIAALPDTGTVQIDNPLFGPTVRFIGDTVSNPQVFTIPAGVAAPASRQVTFIGVPIGTTVYVNVLGSAPDFNVSDVSGTPDRLVDLATHTLWNFPNATNVTLRGGAQFPGSILVPNPASNVVNSMPGTNGRIYVNGNLQHIGTGAEMHSYPFLPDDDLDCLALDPGFTVEKVVDAPAGVVVDPATVYSGTYTCTLTGAPDITGVWSTTAGAGPTVVTADVPVGSVCTLTESPPTTTPPGYVWQPAVFTPESVTITSPDTTTIAFTATNTLAELAGGFTVAKVVGPVGAVPDSTVFSGTYSCVDGAAAPQTGNWSTSVAGPAFAVSGITLGSVCTLTEDTLTPPDTNHVWQPVVFTPSNPFTVTDATVPVAITATNTLTELTGGFTVAKVVTPAGAVPASTVFSGTYSCVDGAAQPQTGTWSTSVAGPAQPVTGIALGSSCTLTEDTPTPPDGNHVWQPVVFTPSNPFTVSDATVPVAITATNTLTELTGGFTVAKTVVGSVPGTATEFTGTYSCTLAGSPSGSGTWSVTAGAAPEVVTSVIPLGSVCTITEDEPAVPDPNHEWADPIISPASVTITEANTGFAFTVTNTLVELPGGFTIAKVVENPDAVPGTATEFTGTYSCTLAGAPSGNGTWSVTAGAAPEVVTSTIPLGSVCTLVETPPVAPDGNHAWQPAVITPASVTITNANTSVGFTVTNTLVELPGGFTVSKTVVDPDSVVPPGTVYSGTFSCDLDGTDVTPTPNTWSTTAGATPAIVTTAVPLGSTCTLVETPPTSPTGNHAWEPAVITPTSVTITNANTSVGFTVTNTLVELPGGFTVAKTVVDPDAVVPPGTVYAGTFSCDLDGTDVTPVPNTWSTTAGAAPVVVTDQVPLGSVCTLVETPPTSPDGNHAWEPAVITPASVTITNANTSVGFTVTNTLTELTGGFTVAKTVVGSVPGTATEFTGTYSCELSGVETGSGTWSVTAGTAPEVVTNEIPLGSVCTIEEDEPVAPDTNHEWQDPFISPANVTITEANTGFAFTVTNTLVELPGGFTVDKTVVDPDTVVDPTTVYSGTFSCDLDGADVTPVPNTWSTTAGAAPVVVTDQIPLGSTCTLVETPPTTPDGNHAWEPAVITPTSVTITDANTSVGFTVTNSLVELPGGFTVDKTVVDPDAVVNPATAYSGTYTCLLDAVDVTPTPNTWSTTAGAAPAIVTTVVPLGSVCTLVETPPTDPDADHEWQPAVITPASVTITDANTSVGFTVTNSLVELPGGFTVDKTVVDPDTVVDPTSVYSGTFSCDLDGIDVTPTPNTWSTTAGAAPMVVTDQVPLGSTCTLTETPPTTPDGNHAWEPAVITPTSVTITDANTSVGFTVTNSLVELPGGFTVDKTVVDPDAVVDPTSVYSGTFSCDLDGTDVTPTPNTWSTTAGATPAIVTTAVPLGSTCTLVETPPTSPDGNHAWEPAVITPASVTITNADTSVGFTVTNSLVELPGGFTVAKTVVDPDAVVPPGTVYAGTFACDLDGTDVTPVPNTWSTTAGAAPVVVTDQVPLGSVCTLVETPPVAPDGNHAWQPAVITPASVTITNANTSVGFTVTNTLTELTGGFTVAKTVVGSVPGTATEFTGTYSCTLAGAPSGNGTWSVTAGAAPAIVTTAVPLGSVCTLVETPPTSPDGNHAWEPAVISPANVTITEANTGFAFTVTNTLVELPGGFTVAKTVVDPDTVVDPTTVYSGTFSCDLDGTDVTPTPNTWSTTAAASPVVVTDQVPLGSVCTVSETPPVAPDGNHAWEPAVITPASVTITNANTSVGFAVTNTLVELPGGFTVDKTVVDPDAVAPPGTVYSGTFSCDLDGTDVTPVPNTWSTTAGAAPAIVTDQVPLGSVCTLVETPPTAPDGNHAWQPAVITPTTVTITNANTSVGFTVTNTLVELPGGFTLAKTVVDPDTVVAPDVTYSGTFSCDLDGTDVTPVPNTWSTTAGAAPVVVTDDVPLGSVCTISETPPTDPDADHAWEPAVITPASVTIANADTSVGFTVTNSLVELPGGFTVAKTVVDPDAVVDPTTVYSGTFSCTLDAVDVTPTPNTWSTTAGVGPVVVTDDVPLGSVCTISETPPTDPDADHAWQPAVITPASVTIANADTSVGFTVTNSLVELPGGFTVAKTVVDPDAVVDPTTVYSGTFSCTLDAVDVTPTPNTWSTTAGVGPVVVTSALPLGSVCTLVETPPTAPDGNHAWQPAQITPASVTIANADTSVGFTVTNSLVELPGGFTVDKTVVDPDAVVPPGTVYSGTFSCDLDGTDVTPTPNTWSTTAGAAPVVVTDQVPLGSVCTLVETPPTAPDGNHAWQPAQITPASVTIANADTSVGFTVTNSLVELPGGFTVAKTVVDPDAVVPPGTVYSGTFSCDLDGTDVTPDPNTWSTTAGAAPAIVTDQVPLGSTCTLVETPPTAPDGNHAWEPAVITPTSVTITNANTSVGFTVTNTLVELPGGFTVAKTVIDPDTVVDPTTVYSGTFSCDLDGTDVTPTPNTWSTTAAASPVVVTDQVPLGSTCTLVETPPTAPDGNHAWQPAQITPASVTIANADTSVGFTVTNSLVELPGGFTVDKTVVDPDAVVPPGTVYSGTFSCDLDGTDVTPTPNTWSTTAGAAPVVVTSAVPLGSVCTLVETPPTAPDGNHAWEPAVITPASVTITNANTSVGFTVTNTLAELAGGFSVTKTVAGDPDGLATGDTFTGTWSCVDGTADPVTGVWSVTAGGPAQTVSGIALGSECTLTEDTPTPPDPNHVWQSTTFTPANPFTVTDATTTVAVTVTNTLAELAGGFSVTKTVTGDPDSVVDPTTVYSGTYTCTLAGAPDVTGTWSTTAGAAPAIVTDQVPLGSTCTLVEAPPTSPDGNHAWQPAQITPATVTITNADTSVGFTVTNTLVELSGGFTVTKVVVDQDGTADPTLEYTGTYTCTLDGTDVTPTPNTWSTTAAAPPVIVTDQIPLGSVCTLEETQPMNPDADHEWRPALISPSSVTITNADTSLGFTVTNSLVVVEGGPIEAVFTVEKLVNDPDGVADPDFQYSGTFSCTLDGTDVTPADNTWTTTAAAPPVVVTDEVPFDSVCTLVETPPVSPDGNHAWQPAVITPATLTIEPDATTTLGFTVTNTLVETGGLTVTKILDDPETVMEASFEYSGTFSCVLDDADVTPTPNTWTTTAGAGPVVVTDEIPLGSVCTLSETPPAAPDASHEWQPAQITPASVTITDATTPVGFTVTNTLTEVLSTGLDTSGPATVTQPTAATTDPNNTTVHSDVEADLASTGPSTQVRWLAWIGLLAVIAGMALVWPFRRARRHER